MKDGLDRSAIEALADALCSVHPTFARDRFVELATKRLRSLELKQRVDRITDALNETVTLDFAAAAPLLVRAGYLATKDRNGPTSGFVIWPLTEYVARHGSGEHFSTAMHALHGLTQLFTAEFAIRPFLENDFDRTMAQLERWTRDSNVHVRRLVSEGTRSRLPWAPRVERLVADPEPTIELLRALRDDPEEYVRRSVANNLNDISKDHPERIIALAREWSRSPLSKERARLLKHACRTLIKEGHADVWDVLGYTRAPKVRVSRFQLASTSIHLGDSLEMSFEISSTSSQRQRLIIDYAVHRVLSDGTRRPKVFKLAERELDAGEAIEVTKRHAMRKVTTRRYYSGEHRVELLVNGTRMARASFTLEI